MVKITLITNNPRKSVIANENDTVKAILEANDVNYVNAATAIDGATLGVGEINKTLSELGITEKAVISCLANKDNAATAVVTGCACVVTSALKLDQIKRLKKIFPEALSLQNEDGEEIFRMDYDESTPGSLNKYGAMYGGAVTDEGYATITMVLEPDTPDPAETVFEKLGRPLMDLSALESGILEQLPDMDNEEAEIRSHIIRN